MNTVFIDLSGRSLKEHIGKCIYTQSQSRDKEVILLQTKLNSAIDKYANKLANAENCKALWEMIMAIIVNTEVTNKEDSKYKEIIKRVEEIGYTIAYMNKRINGGWQYIDVKITDFANENLVEPMKVIILNEYNMKKEFIDWTYKGVKPCDMTDEQIMELALDLKNNQIKKLEEKAGFKVSDVRQELNGLDERDALLLLDKSNQIIAMLKDRQNTLENGNEEAKLKYQAYIESGNADSFDSMDIEVIRKNIKYYTDLRNKAWLYFKTI